MNSQTMRRMDRGAYRQTGASPSRIEVSKGVGDIAGHADHDGPLAAEVLDHYGWQEHGGDDDGGVDDTQRCHPHPLLRIQTALDRRDTR